jgi:hypothetical protein
VLASVNANVAAEKKSGNLARFVTAAAARFGDLDWKFDISGESVAIDVTPRSVPAHPLLTFFTWFDPSSPGKKPFPDFVVKIEKEICSTGGKINVGLLEVTFLAPNPFATVPSRPNRS